MNPRRWSSGSVVSFGLWSLTLQTIVLRPVRTAEPSSRNGADSGSRVRLPAGLAAITVNQAIEGAKRKLAKAECQAVLNEFTDASGHSLAAILLEREKTAPQYLGELVFYDGREVARCQKLETAAVTTPATSAARSALRSGFVSSTTGVAPLSRAMRRYRSSRRTL